MARRYFFEAGARGRNLLSATWDPPGAVQIALAFTPASLAVLLEAAIRDDGQYSHYAIATWCDQYLQGLLHDETDDLLLPVQKIVEDISVQWDLYLLNTYTVDQLSGMALADVRLPEGWFSDWLCQLARWQENVLALSVQALKAHYGDRYRAYGGGTVAGATAFRIRDLAVVFSVILDVEMGSVLYDVQVESDPPGDYIRDARIKPGQLLALVQDYERAPTDWP
ncbi:hypothetical protein [Corticimicrobacter populi]|uniref:Uncharacterized protein n=1 Tax=Corticimicrobacter populi TaxID=2175229 RepID=A0A2V1K1B0_9BURK|nr:hypothetical protein [Corticimicrobacter populi]PWF24921.1 hypothetical protein DD235_01720 [Corticimicrobacter populi]